MTFLLPGSVCAIAADRKSTDTVWFIKIKEEKKADVPRHQPLTDDYGDMVSSGLSYIEGHYLEFQTIKGKCQVFKKMSKKWFIFKSSYPQFCT